MADRSPLFSTKGGTQIGYVENGGAFDLLGKRRCDYNTATGNLSDPVTEKIVAYVSKEGSFVVHRGSRPSCLSSLAIVKLRRRLWLPKASTPKNT
jgi:hypothetical protein